METKEIIYDKIFDYSEFLESGSNTDCELKFPDQPSIFAHKLVLANSSKFFFNAFTGNMTEQQTGIVSCSFNPDNILEKVVKYMYNGKIQFSNSELMQLYATVNYYGIDSLRSVLEEKIDKEITPENMLDYCNICYEKNLNEVLNILAVKIGQRLDEYSVDKLTDILDVRVYALALKNSKLDARAKLNHIRSFIRDYELDQNEKESLLAAVGNGPVVDELINSIFPQLKA